MNSHITSDTLRAISASHEYRHCTALYLQVGREGHVDLLPIWSDSV